MDTVFRIEHIFNYSMPYVCCMSNFIRPIRQYSILVCNSSVGGLSRHLYFHFYSSSKEMCNNRET
jgi:hypothetical protein